MEYLSLAKNQIQLISSHLFPEVNRYRVFPWNDSPVTCVHWDVRVWIVLKSLHWRNCFHEASCSFFPYTFQVNTALENCIGNVSTWYDNRLKWICVCVSAWPIQQQTIVSYNGKLDLHICAVIAIAYLLYYAIQISVPNSWYICALSLDSADMYTSAVRYSNVVA